MVSLSLRVDLAPGGRMGPGKISLLERIAELGSIAAAGRSMGMSYRRAWELVEDLNRYFVEPVVETRMGGSTGGGAALTPFGHEIVTRYRAIEAKAARAVADELSALQGKLATTPAERPPRRILSLDEDGQQGRRRPGRPRKTPLVQSPADASS